MPRRTLSQVQKLQASSLGYLLIRCSQIWGDRAIAQVNAEAGRPVLREAHTRLLPYLQTPDGIRITDLAKAVGVTKQAAQPLVAELAEQGIVHIQPDRSDARAKRVFLTERGLDALVHGTGVLLRIEDELAQRLGPRARQALKTNLEKLLAVLQVPANSPPANSPPARAAAPKAAQSRVRRRRDHTR